MLGKIYAELEEVKKEHIIDKFWLKGLLDGFKKDKVKKLEEFPRCRLNRFFKSPAGRKLKSWQRIKELERIHVEFHVMVKMIIRLHESGMKEASLAKFKELENISRRMIIMLTELQRYVKDEDE